MILRRIALQIPKRIGTLKVPVLAAFIAVTAPAVAHSTTIPIPDLVAEWNELWHELIIDITVIGVFFTLATLYLLIKYRRRKPDEVGKGKELSPLGALGWVLIPLFIFLADDIYLAAKNFELWNKYRTVPENSYVINVEAGMWSWDFKYPDGFTTTNELVVEVGRPVKLNLTSRDVVHSFFIPDYKTKWDAVPGRTNYLWFNPKEVGEHILTCTEFCGALHSKMYGKVIVKSTKDFNGWIANMRKENKL